MLIVNLQGQGPVDKLFEFQQLMKQKTKVPKQQISDYDSSDIFSEGYIMTEINEYEDDDYDNNENTIEYEYYDDIDDEDNQEEIIKQIQLQKELEEQMIAQQLERQRIEQEKLEQQRLEKIKFEEQQLIEQKRKEQEMLKIEQMQRMELIQENEQKKQKQMIIIPDQWSDNDEDLQQNQRKKKKQKKQENNNQEIEQTKKTKVQSLGDFDEVEQKIMKRKRKVNQQDEFVSKIPAQNQTFIHFNNKNNNLELAPCSSNPIQQRACSLCKSEVGYQLDDDNWYMIGLQHGYKKEFLLLIEITKQSFGESQLYLSFQSNGSACLSSSTLKSEIEIETVLQRFSNRSWRHFIKNEQFSLPDKLEGKSFQFKASYINKQFIFTDFEISFNSNLIQELKSQSNSPVYIKTTKVDFFGDNLSSILSGIIKQQNDELQFTLKMNNGETYTELIIPNCQIPLHNELLNGISDMYFGENFKEALLQKLNGSSFKADLNVTTSFENGKLKVKFALKKK